ncbi:MAG: hypothetical protein AAFX04_03375 [Pseudomonadota bacterium]
MITKTLSGGLMMAAAVTMAAPAQAAPVSAGIQQSYDLQQLRQNPIEGAQWDPSDETADRWRRGRRCGWGRCRRGVRGGDILAGALILGGIVAIASAASNNNRRRDRDVVVREVPRPDPRIDPRFDDRRFDDRRSGASELSEAADQCSFAVQGQAGNDARIDRITTVARDGNGWRVEGLLAYPNGRDSFLCGVTAGQIDYVQIGTGNSAEEF